ncbi:hypothetical protein QFZ20_005243 [Flavobacterium sp. W4I14]|nr:hypothetical protein [Flavobacterium sp. W4I14]
MKNPAFFGLQSDEEFVEITLMIENKNIFKYLLQNYYTIIDLFCEARKRKFQHVNNGWRLVH